MGDCTSYIAELFEKVAHPTHVKIIGLLEDAAMAFGQLKDKLGIVSSGNLDYHLRKLDDLVLIDANGLYRLSDEGKEALRAIRTIESSLSTRKSDPYHQSRWVLGMAGALFALFTSAVLIVVLSLGDCPVIKWV